MGKNTNNPDRIIIGTRGSKLALWQAEWVKDALLKARPGLDVRIEILKSEGDTRHDLAPEAFGREGIFTAELETALLDMRIDLAVHSLKDLPIELSPGLSLSAVTERASTRDVFILRSDLAAGLESGNKKSSGAPAVLDRDYKVGTSSLRRITQLKHEFPGLQFAPMRGNLDTRIRKLNEKQYDAIVVAEAGLDRLGIKADGHMFVPLEPDWYLPAAGQGALAVETRADDPAGEIAALLDHPETRAVTQAERAAMRAMGAGCRVPAGFLGEVSEAGLLVKGAVGSPDGAKLVKAEVSGDIKDPRAAGKALSEKLLDMGAGEILAEVRG